MNRTFTLFFALGLGLLGGSLSRYIAPLPAFAQAQAQRESQGAMPAR
jgi:hypothetical protein